MTCNRCHENKEPSEFYPSKTGKFGLSTTCKECKKASARKWQQDNKERFEQTKQAYRAANKDKYTSLWNSNSRKRRALRNNNGHSPYTTQEVLDRYGSLCYLCLEEVDLEAPRFYRRKDEVSAKSLHIDHVIALHHGGEDSLDNVRPAHAVCNLKKGYKLIPTTK